MSINPFNIELQDETNEKCIICHENLNTAQTYKLPECNHTYHTHCIVTWFRHSLLDEDSNLYNVRTYNGKCPICGNKGINNVEPKKKRRRYRFKDTPFQSGELIRYNFIMRESRKSTAPKELLKIVEQLEKSKLELQKAENKLKDYNNKIKTELVRYDEVKPNIRKLTDQIWRKISVVDNYKLAIVNFPIVPIIIPKPVDLNS